MDSEKKFRIAFLGSDEIALPFLLNLERSVPQCEISAVLTQPDRPSGRGRKLTPNPIKQWAMDHSIDHRDPISPGMEEITWLESLRIDLLLVMAYGHILRQPFLEVAQKGCFNLHASILPYYRGASPIESALAMGEKQTGVSLMRIVPKMDAGPLVDMEKVNISSQMNGSDLRQNLSEACLPLLKRNLPLILSGNHSEVPQDESKATYCRKLVKADGFLDFSLTANELECRIRAFKAWPGSSFIFQQSRIRVGGAISTDNVTHLSPGEVGENSSGNLTVGTAKGSLEINLLQKPGGRMISAKEFLRGFTIPIGTLLPIEKSVPLIR